MTRWFLLLAVTSLLYVALRSVMRRLLSAPDTAPGHPPPGGGRGRGRREPMGRAEALEILGLSEGATRDDVVAAHRRLMQRLHPDAGGSDYLAAQINRARDVLLGRG
ncbi:MAG: hypothetical protein PVI30_20720 [Myxococcales bacterium]|jgi:hypothetical protein